MHRGHNSSSLYACTRLYVQHTYQKQKTEKKKHKYHVICIRLFLSSVTSSVVGLFILAINEIILILVVRVSRTHHCLSGYFLLLLLLCWFTSEWSSDASTKLIDTFCSYMRLSIGYTGVTTIDNKLKMRIENPFFPLSTSSYVFLFLVSAFCCCFFFSVMNIDIL